MKRVRKVMDESSRNRPGDRLIDMHSGNSFPEAATSNAYPNFSYPSILNLTCQFGCVSPALCYMQHMGFMDSTMFGEGFGAHLIPPYAYSSTEHLDDLCACLRACRLRRACRLLVD